MNSLALRYLEQHGGSDVRRWGVCFAIILALHAVPAALFTGVHHSAAVPVVAPPPAAIMVDMEPPPAPAPASPSKVPNASRPQQVAGPTPRQPVRREKPPPIKKTVLPVSSGEQPGLPQLEDPASSSETSAPPRNAPAADAGPSVPSIADAPSHSLPTWQGLVVSRLQQFQRYPDEAKARGQQGVAQLRFTMDREGQVLSFRLEKSSGHDLLDEEVLALIERAQPLPKPPADVAGIQVELIVPIEFFLRDRRQRP